MRHHCRFSAVLFRLFSRTFEKCTRKLVKRLPRFNNISPYKPLLISTIWTIGLRLKSCSHVFLQILFSNVTKRPSVYSIVVQASPSYVIIILEIATTETGRREHKRDLCDIMELVPMTDYVGDSMVSPNKTNRQKRDSYKGGCGNFKERFPGKGLAQCGLRWWTRIWKAWMLKAWERRFEVDTDGGVK